MGFDFTRAKLSYLGLFSLCTLLFALRVAGQALQNWAPQPWLPSFGAFQGSSLSYGALLGIQLLILTLMLRVCLRLAWGRLPVRPRQGQILPIFGFVYAAGSLVRIAIGLGVSTAPAWFSTWIPAMLHIVLAAFVLSLAHYHLRARAESVS